MKEKRGEWASRLFYDDDYKERRYGMKHTLTIKPAVPASERHQIEDLLERLGYEIVGGGTDVDGSESDISFERR